jgi:hypothetical protein
MAQAFAAHGDKLAREIDYLTHASSAYLFHEYLTDIHRAEDFADFAAALAAHGLRYAGEAGPRHAVVGVDSAATWLETEQSLDEQFEQRFRRALARRADAPAALPPDATALPQLAYAADLHCEDELDLAPGLEQVFIAPGEAPFAASHALTKAALAVLSQSYPAMLGWDAMLDAAQALLAACDLTAAEDDDFRAEWFALVMAHAVRIGVHPWTFMHETGATPRAAAFARAQAAYADVTVTGAHHNALDLDHWGRELLLLLDGARNRDRLRDEMRARLNAADIQASDEALAARIEDMLALFARQGLLEARPA